MNGDQNTNQFGTVVKQDDTQQAVQTQPLEIQEITLDDRVKEFQKMGYTSIEIARILTESKRHSFDEVFNYYRLEDEKRKEEMEERQREMERMNALMQQEIYREKKKDVLLELPGGQSVLESAFGGNIHNVITAPGDSWNNSGKVTPNKDKFYQQAIEDGNYDYNPRDINEETADIDFYIIKLRRDLREQIREAERNGDTEFVEKYQGLLSSALDYQSDYTIHNPLTAKGNTVYRKKGSDQWMTKTEVEAMTLTTAFDKDDWEEVPFLDVLPTEEKGFYPTIDILNKDESKWLQNQGNAESDLKLYFDPQLDPLANTDKSVIEAANKVRFGEALIKAAVGEWNNEETPYGSMSLEELIEEAKKYDILSEGYLSAASLTNFSDNKDSQQFDILLAEANRMIQGGTEGYKSAVETLNGIYEEMGSDLRIDPGRRSDFDAVVKQASDRGLYRTHIQETKRVLDLEEYYKGSTPLSPYIIGDKKIEDLPEDLEVTYSNLIYNSLNLEETRKGLHEAYFDHLYDPSVTSRLVRYANPMGPIYALQDWAAKYELNKGGFDYEQYKEESLREGKYRQRLEAEMEMIYRMQRGYDKNKAWEKGLIGRTGDFMDGDISLDDWWEATYLKTGLVAAQGTKYILEASIPYVGVAVLATDVFGNSYNDISVNHPEWPT